MSRDQNAGQNGNIQIDNKSFETMEQFKYLGTPLTNQNCIYEEIWVDWSQGILPIIECRISCLPVCCPKIYRLRYTEL